MPYIFVENGNWKWYNHIVEKAVANAADAKRAWIEAAFGEIALPQKRGMEVRLKKGLRPFFNREFVLPHKVPT